MSAKTFLRRRIAVMSRPERARLKAKPWIALSSIPRAPKALYASPGCDLIRRSICPAVHAPGITDAQSEPSRQKRVDQRKDYG